ncbi:MAG: hypothetical protein ABIE74_01045 [Pseudomonadota bacterium]
MADLLKIVKEVQKGIKRLTKKLEKSNNPKLKEMEKRFKEIDEKLAREFNLKKKK